MQKTQVLTENDAWLVETFPTGSYACNCTVVRSKETKRAWIMDPGNDLPQIKAYIGQHQLKVQGLYHTHAHFDHIGESFALKQEHGCPLYLHPDDEELYRMLPMQGQWFNQKVGRLGPFNEKVKLVDQYLEQDFSFEGFKTLETPGHTPGSCCFFSSHLPLPILVSGDTLFRQSIGRTDLPGGDFDQIKQSIKQRLYTLPEETIVVPGHGPLTRIYDEKKSNPFVNG